MGTDPDPPGIIRDTEIEIYSLQSQNEDWSEPIRVLFVRINTKKDLQCILDRVYPTPIRETEIKIYFL